MTKDTEHHDTDIQSRLTWDRYYHDKLIIQSTTIQTYIAQWMGSNIQNPMMNGINIQSTKDELDKYIFKAQ